MAADVAAQVVALLFVACFCVRFWRISRGEAARPITRVHAWDSAPTHNAPIIRSSFVFSLWFNIEYIYQLSPASSKAWAETTSRCNATGHDTVDSR